MVATNKFGKRERDRSLFDHLTVDDFKNTNVRCLDVQDLLEEYAGGTVVHKSLQNIDVYTLVERFIERNRDSSIVIDECPFLANPDNIGPPIDCIINALVSKKYAILEYAIS